MRNTENDFFFLGKHSLTMAEDVPLIDGIARVELACQDYGGSASIVAILVAEGNVVFTTVLDIPLSSGSDGIADHWKATSSTHSTNGWCARCSKGWSSLNPGRRSCALRWAR